MTYATVRSATAQELTYIRTPGQWSRLYLAVFKPSTVYSATLSSIPASTDRVVEISFTNGSGTLADVLPDMTLYVGSTVGGYDLGVARIRKAPIAGKFYIGEESDINWSGAVTVYLTVVNEFDLWAKHINTVNDTTFYMDYDIVYTDQNNVFNPVPIMGGHRVLKLTGLNVSTQFNWSNSYCIGSSVSSYSVSCSTATITGGTTSTPTLQFTSTGWHMVVLTVTAANGKTSTGIRYVYVYSTANPPSTVFQLENCSCDYQVGGWNFSVTMQGQIGLSDVPERTMCILFSEDYYGSTNVSVGQLAGCENIICVGKIAEETFDINPEQGEVTLQVHGMQYWMSQIYAFPTGVILTTGTPANWAEMGSPTIDKVLFRLLHWGSTATKIMDVYLSNDVRIASELISPASNLWGQIVEISFSTIYANPGIDRYGRLFVETEPQIVPLASRTWATVMEITKSDWHDNIKMQRVIVSPTGIVSSSGVSVNSSGDAVALFSLSAGHVFKHYGQPEMIDRLLLSTQALGNQFAGLVLGWKNNPFPNSEFTLSSNNRMIDCFPRQYVEWQMLSSDNPRGFGFGLTKFIPRRIEMRWSDETGFIEVGLSLEMSSVEQPDVNGDIPGNGGIDLGEPPEPPPFPELPPPPVITGTDVTVGTQYAILYSTRYGVMYTKNFEDASPYWYQMNGGFGQLPNGVDRWTRVHRLYICPNGAIYAVRLATISGQGWNDTDRDFFIYRSPGIGQDFAPILSKWVNWSGTPSFFDSHGIESFGVDTTRAEAAIYIALQGPSAPPLEKIYTGYNTSWSAGSTAAWGTLGTGGGDHSGLHLSYGNGKWILAKDFGSWSISTNGTLGAWSPVAGQGWDTSKREWFSHFRGGSSNVIYGWGDNTGSPALRFLKTIDGYATTTEIRNADVFANGTGVDATGQYLMTCGPSIDQTRFKSTDGGASWSPLSNLPVGGYWKFINAGGPLLWVASFGTSIRHTKDGGLTWYNKEGNLISEFPLTDIVAVYWVGGS